MQAIIIREHEVPASQVEASGQRLMSSLPGATIIEMAPARRRNWWWSAAAAVLLVMAGTYLWTSLNNQSSIKTSYGQVTQKQLPDGSEVVLNANSSISYSSGWEEGKEREVWIKGEAFFHVKKTPNKSRFVVHTNEMDIIVTGTQFNVVSRSDKSSVMLTEGSVFIRTKDGKETKMAPGDFVEISNSQLEKKAMKEEAVLAWKDKKIVFNNTPLYEVVQQIKEHYGEEVTIADDALAHKTITGMMPNDNLEVLLKSLEAILECSVIRKDGRIIIANP
jgi:ferric-dicitrate binding protein FerR (iron transport regulator)